MGDWQKWGCVVGGLIAVIGQFWGGADPTNYYLPLIGGVIAVICGFLVE